MPKTDRNSARFMLRLPHELDTRIRCRAAAQGRTVTAEIIQALEAAFQPLVPHSPARGTSDLDARISAIVSRQVQDELDARGYAPMAEGAR